MPDAGGSAFYASASGTSSAAVAVTLATPIVVVTPSFNNISTTQPLTVMVSVSGAGGPTATGSITLSAGSYTSAATALTSGSTAITITAGTLAAGSYTFKAIYAPDAGSASIYASASGTASTVTVGVVTPTVTVTPSSNSINVNQALTVTVALTGNPPPTGSVTLFERQLHFGVHRSQRRLGGHHHPCGHIDRRQLHVQSDLHT